MAGTTLDALLKTGQNLFKDSLDQKDGYDFFSNKRQIQQMPAAIYPEPSQDSTMPGEEKSRHRMLP